MPAQQCNSGVNQVRARFPLATALVQARALTARDLQTVKIDKAIIEEAIEEYLSVSGLSARPLRWFHGGRSARAYLAPYEARPTYWPFRFSMRPIVDAAWNGIASWHLEPRRPTDFQPDGLEVFSAKAANSAVLGPLLTAFLAGLLGFRVGRNEVVCITRPSLWGVDGQLHRADGPAIRWSTGEQYFFWRGTRVPSWFIEQPYRITWQAIFEERNAELRRCMIERLGPARFLEEACARLIHSDEFGALWQVRDRAVGGDIYTAVEVENGTCEADGMRRRYFLQVPPWMMSAREAVAWTYGLRADEYQLAART